MKKHMKKSVLPLFLIALCFITAKVPVVSPTVSEDEVEQVMPLSDLDDDKNAEED